MKNNLNVSINLYAFKKEEKNEKTVNTVFPIKVVKDEKPDHFDLLLINNNQKTHYTFISNFSRLVRSQKTCYEHEVVFCKRCFTAFDSRPCKNKLSGQAALDQHKLICGEHNPILPVMPEPGTDLKFESWGKTQRHSIVLNADFLKRFWKRQMTRKEKIRLLYTTINRCHTGST